MLNAIAEWDDLPRNLSTGAVLLQLGDGRLARGAAKGLTRLGALNVPSVAVLSGACGPSDLTAALVSSIAYADESVRMDLSDTAELLSLSVPWRLEQRGAGWLLFAAATGAHELIAASLARPGSNADARAVAEQLAASPSKALLVRSLRAASRNSSAQSALYDSELVRLLASGAAADQA